MIGAPLKSYGQENLADDGTRVWDDELRSRLDKEYSDWKYPKGTYMVPPSFKGLGNDADEGKKAEEKVYNLLHDLGREKNEPMFVVHSFNFNEHIPGSREKEKTWVIGESDFLVIHRKYGPIFFEVKASKTGNSCKANNQICKDKLVLKNFFRKMVKGNISTIKATDVFYNCPGFVVLPNSPRGQQSVCTPDNVLCQEECSSLEAFSRWWDEKIGGARLPLPDQTIFEYLVMWFVGSTHTGHCLSYSIDKSHGVLVFKTKEQLNVLLNTTPEQWITGPAGSGKTWLLMEKVMELAKKAIQDKTNEKILVVCNSKPLSKMFLATFKKHSVVKVMTFDELLCDITKLMSGDSKQEKEEHVTNAVELLENGSVPIQQYDHIFVDECQDLCGDKWPILFAKLQKNADVQSVGEDDGVFIEAKHIWFLYDTNQYLGLSYQQDQFLREARRKTTRLSVVLRNTGNVFHQSRKYFKSKVTGELQLGHREFGLPIEWDDSLPSTEDPWYQGAEAIKKHICKLRLHKVKDQDICVLVRDTEIRDGLKSKLEDLEVETQDAEELFEKVQNKIIIESIQRFKGLESKVVVLYNPPFLVKDWSVNERLYTALSRCFCYLVVITTKHGCKALRSKKGMRDKIIRAASKQDPATLCSSEDQESAIRSQRDAEKRPFETFINLQIRDDIDDGDKDETRISPPKIKRTEEAAIHQQRSSEGALLEPGDHSIKDSIRKKASSPLYKTVKQNLQNIPSTSNLNQSSSDVPSVVAQIEYEVYSSRRSERDPKKYTEDLSDLNREIENCNRSPTSHESVERALGLSKNSS